jgi:hypothetical protein
MRQSILKTAGIAGLLSATAVQPALAGVPDQCMDHTFTRGTNGQQFEQQIRAGLSGQLEGITFYFYAVSLAGTSVTVNVYEDATSCLSGSETVSFTETYTVSQAGVVEEYFMDMTAANIQLQAGETFVVEFINDPNGGGATTLRAGSGGYSEPACMLGFPRPDNAAFCTSMVGGGPSLDFAGTCPGPVDVFIDGITPGGSVAVVKGNALGSSAIPGGPCAGQGLDISGPSLVTIVPDNDNDGSIQSTPNLNAGVCGKPIQVVDVNTCETSNVAFP